MAAKSTVKKLILVLLAGGVSAADLPAPNGYPPEQCLSQCELAGTCEEREFDEYPGYESTLAIIEGECADPHLYAIAGTCADGKKILRTGNGTTSEIRFFDPGGGFLGLMTQTDVVTPVCRGQSFWPRYPRCEAPTVERNICGASFEPGAPAFENRWDTE